MQLTEYIQKLTDQIRCKKAHPMIIDEYRSHIEDQAETFVQCGMEQKEAMEAAVAQMGDPVEAGVALDRVHRPKMCISMMVTVFVLTLIGIVAQAVIFKEFDNSWVQEKYVYYSIFYNLVGFAVMAVVCYLDYSFLSKHVVKVYVCWYFSVILLAFSTELFAYYTRRIACYQLMALFGPIFAGILFRYRNQGIKGFLKATLFLILAIPLCQSSGKIAGMVEMYAVVLILWTFAFLKGWYGNKGVLKTVLMWIGAILLPVIVVINILMGPGDSFRAMRLKAYLNPAIDEGGMGYGISRIREAIGDFTLFGTTSTLEGTLPNTYNDYIVLSIFSYFGILIGIIVCASVAFFFIKAFRISFKQKNQLAQLVGISCAMELLVRAVIYIGANFGVCPIAQTNMPFLSFGLQGILVNSILTGLLLSIYRYKNVLGEKQMNVKYRYKLKIEKVEL